MTNTCIYCKQEKELTANFDKTTQTRSGFRNVCKQCRREREYLPASDKIKADRRSRYDNDPEYRERRKASAILQYKANKPLKQQQSRKSALKTRYGMTPEDYFAMVEAQGGVCLVCKKRPEESDARRKRLCVDHNHTTGKVRGLLCNVCNRGLGEFYDSPALLQAAIAYLASYE